MALNRGNRAVRHAGFLALLAALVGVGSIIWTRSPVPERRGGLSRVPTPVPGVSGVPTSTGHPNGIAGDSRRREWTAVDAEGKPLPGGRRGDQVTDAGLIIMLRAPGQPAITIYPDEQGRFVSPGGSDLAEYRIAGFDSRSPADLQTGTIDPDPDQGDGGRVTFNRSESRGSVAIRCIDSEGAPVSAALRIVRKLSVVDEVTVARLTTSAEDGTCGATLVGEGPYEVIVDSVSTRAVQSYRGVRRVFDLSDAGERRIEIVLDKPGRIDVLVTGEAGAQLAGALIGLRYSDSGITRASPMSGQSDSDGRFAFEKLDPGPIALVATKGGYLPAIERLWVLPGESRTVVMAMERGGGTLHGRLSGLPAEFMRRMTIFLNVCTAHPEEAHSVWGAKVEADGAFEFSGLASATYELNILSGKERRVAMIVAALGQETDVGDVDLGPVLKTGNGTIQCRVETNVLGARSFKGLFRKSTWAPGMWASFELLPESRTIEGLEEGHYTVMFSPTVNDCSSYSTSHVVDVDVPQSGKGPEVVLLAPGIK